MTRGTTEREPTAAVPINGNAPPHVLAVNGGSSSIKFALYRVADPPQRQLYGKVDRIGLAGASLTATHIQWSQPEHLSFDCANHRSAAESLIQWLAGKVDFTGIKAVGHRVVHGMKFTEPETVTPNLLDELRRICPYDPDHLPREIELIEAFRQCHPELLQVACFDTAFHRTMPRKARLIPIPRRFESRGVQRYGFHGLSYAYLMEQLASSAGTEAARGRIILAHLGNGASLAAIQDGKSIDTSMGFTPTAGIPMGTRPGDLDPGVAWFLMRTEHLTAKQFNQLINHESGLLGISETSSDMRDLMGHQTTDIRAAEAVECFCYQARKWVGAFTAALGGLDTLVFSGGIGENSSEVRMRITDGLGFLGLEIDATKNLAHAPVISTDQSRVTVRVIRTDEELMIAKTLCRLVGGQALAAAHSNRQAAPN